MKNNKRLQIIGFIVLFCAGILLISEILSFLLLPNVSYFRQTAHDATSEKNKYDVVCIGSSEELYCFNAPMATEMLNKVCYNMGTSGTTTAGGVYSTYKLFMKNQNPELVIIMLNTSSLQADAEDAVAYAGIAPYTGDVFLNVEYFLRTCFEGGELHRLFPWSAHHIDNKDELIENLHVKTSEAYRSYDAAVLPSESLVYKGQGYCPQLPGEDNSNVIVYEDTAEITNYAQSSRLYDEVDFNPKQEKALISMIKQSHKSGAEVMVIMSPSTKAYMASSTNYAKCSEQIHDIAESNDAEFVNLNYAKPELYDPQPLEYVDDYHVLESGADRFTESLCNYILMKQNGEDVSSMFYDSWEEFVQSYDWSIYKGLN